MAATIHGRGKGQSPRTFSRNGAKLGLFRETAKFGGVENSAIPRIYRITLYIGVL